MKSANNVFLYATLWLAALNIPVFGNYFDTNILAVAVGYQTQRTLPSGVTVPAFSLAEEAGNGNEKGVLFAVVAPTNLLGKFFWLAHEGPIDNSGASFYDHNPDGVYSFRFGKLTDEDPYQLAQEDLFSMPSPVRYLCTIRPYGRRFFLSKEEVSRRLAFFDKKIEACKRELEKLIQENKTGKLNKRGKTRLLGKMKVLEESISEYEVYKREVSSRSSEIENNRKILFGSSSAQERANEMVSPSNGEKEDITVQRWISIDIPGTFEGQSDMNREANRHFMQPHGGANARTQEP